MQNNSFALRPLQIECCWLFLYVNRLQVQLKSHQPTSLGATKALAGPPPALAAEDPGMGSHGVPCKGWQCTRSKQDFTRLHWLIMRESVRNDFFHPGADMECPLTGMQESWALRTAVWPMWQIWPSMSFSSSLYRHPLGIETSVTMLPTMRMKPL